MIFAKCPRCKKMKFLTRHSKIGNHQPPFILICRNCHNYEHGMNPPRIKRNKKYQLKTKRVHKKGWRKN